MADEVWTNAEIRYQLTNVFARFDQLGYDLRRGRLGKYAAVLEEVMAGRHVDPKELESAAAEVADLNRICQLPAETLRAAPRLTSIRKGPVVRAPDAGTFDPGRDTCFQLFTAAFFHECGLRVKLEDPTDVVGEGPDDAILVECKRVSSDKALVHAIDEAYSQFKEHRRNCAVGIGVVAVDISTLVNPHSRMMISKDPDTTQRYLQSCIAHVTQANRGAIAKINVRDRVAAQVHALSFRLRTSVLQSETLLATASAWQSYIAEASCRPQFDKMERMLRHPSGPATVRDAPPVPAKFGRLTS